MNKISFYRIAATFILSAFFLTSCDQDFTDIGSSIVDDEHFAFRPDTLSTIKAYVQPTGVLQSNNLPINPLGIYVDPVFGKVKANFVTQLELGTVNPVFDPEKKPVLDSVVLTIPYFSTRRAGATSTEILYDLDSIQGSAPINLKVFESGFILNELNPEDNFQSAQRYFTNQDADFDRNKRGTMLNNSTDPAQNTAFRPSDKGVIGLRLDRGLQPVIPKEIETNVTPRLRLKLDRAFFEAKIMNAPAGRLLNNTIFREYFRGIYFQVQDAPSGTLMQLDFSRGDITLHYREYASIVNGEPEKYEDSEQDSYGGQPRLVARTLALNMRGQTVSLLETENSQLYASGIASPNKVSGDSKLFLKGGEGSVAIIDLFGADNFGADGLTGTPDGVADELNIIRNSGWLINEANITFYIDRDAMGNAPEPQRIYLFDLNNNRPLVDFNSDVTGTATAPKSAKIVHDGIIQNEDDRGLRYRIRITNHIRNLIRRDSTNVRLGLAVTEAIGITSSVRLKTPVFEQPSEFRIDRIPSASLLNPFGTILYGSNIPPGNADYRKRIKLEIYYTKPN